MTHRYSFPKTFRVLGAIVLLLSWLSVAPAMAADSAYEAELLKWKSHQEVADWLKSNFVFDRSRQAQVQAQLKETGPENALTRKPATLFEKRNGYCRDAAGFAKDAMNKINPAYQARYIFIKNKSGPTNHWVTGYMVDNKLFVMDYGAGKHWAPIEGVHGPYATLDDYKTFLASLNVQGFAPDFVRWRDIPGQED